MTEYDKLVEVIAEVIKRLPEHEQKSKTPQKIEGYEEYCLYHE